MNAAIWAAARAKATMVDSRAVPRRPAARNKPHFRGLMLFISALPSPGTGFVVSGRLTNPCWQRRNAKAGDTWLIR
jgi:hypothetical protein